MHRNNNPVQPKKKPSLNLKKMLSNLKIGKTRLMILPSTSLKIRMTYSIPLRRTIAMMRKSSLKAPLPQKHNQRTNTQTKLRLPLLQKFNQNRLLSILLMIRRPLKGESDKENYSRKERSKRLQAKRECRIKRKS